MTTVAEHIADDAGATPRTDASQAAVRQKVAKRHDRHALAACLGLAVVAAGCWAGLQYWTVWRFMESTDDAYVQADSTIVAPRVSGYVAALLVDDNQSVKAGQTLTRIDDRDFRTALDEATASVSAAAASVANLGAQITAQESQIRQADASVAAATASLSLSQRNDVRRRTMAQVGYGSDEQADDASTDAREKAANLERLQAAALSARQQVDVLATQRQQAQTQLARAEAAKRQAELNLSYATVTNAADGVRTEQQALGSASSALRLTRLGYGIGNAGIIQVLDAQRLQQLAELSLVRAQTQRYTQTVNLFLAAGGGITGATQRGACKIAGGRKCPAGQG
ncbi:MAG TPA: biotin/lipoyl-binding protein [Rhodopseudomonas sp.]|uniref:biotin/lipoyl-binding protein n=1 Tax=Rhodopseudomonas sp. TaxID=1078 RepID=UPI002ED9710C